MEEDSVKQQAKTIFVTGSSSGLGRATAKLFSSRGWNVIATMRNPEKEKELATLPKIVLLAAGYHRPPTNRAGCRKRDGTG